MPPADLAADRGEDFGAIDVLLRQFAIGDGCLKGRLSFDVVETILVVLLLAD